ncbi:uncharacterized protein N0V89_011826 [Didymosphaeria variabile]|uniref:Dpy-30 domain-containing protein n=1 Tax=Didymosphaeria variabile TaxID=1932322 RepID=A0A9W9C539_9PLEO|nr:uncharacterized protein N0V89_011826 [Didymosphaeria variabile]KAJ4345691.1 hypothetical protein N0V89_011826 [Didymosphaeria variabile]
MSPPTPKSPFLFQTGRSLPTPLVTLNDLIMADPSQETLPQTASVASPTTVAAPALAPISNGTPAEDVEMADSAPAQPSAVEQSAPTETSAIASESAPAPPSEPQAQPPPVQQQQQPAQPALSAPSPAPAPASSRNSPHPSGPAQIPVHATLHGAPTRQYLNQHVTPHLLEAMKHLVTEEPEKPLEFLSKWLAQKSAELEG